MQFMAIAPSDIASAMNLWDRSAQMCLAQIALKDPNYFKAFRLTKEQQKGKTIILDNGAYENEQVSDEELVGLALLLRPNYVTLPDVPNSNTSYNKSHMFQLRFGKLLAEFNISTIAIIHVHPNYHWLDQHIDRYLATFKNFGLSRLAKFHEKFSRPKLAEKIKTEKTGAYVHAFGYLGKTDLEDCKFVGVNSLDSSAPVWRGCMGHGILNPNWPDYPVEFSCPWRDIGAANQLLAKENLEKVDSWLS